MDQTLAGLLVIVTVFSMYFLMWCAVRVGQGKALVAPNIIPRRVVNAVKYGRWDMLWYSVMTRLRRLDLCAVEPSALGLDPTLAHCHADSGGPDLVKVLKRCNITKDDRILDMGSGKGGAMFSMARFPFAEVAGVEVARELDILAKHNAGKLGLYNLRFICQDAAKYTDLDRFTYIYFFNPFPLTVMSKVMANLKASLARAPRKLILIYKYPGCPDLYVDRETFMLHEFMTFKGSHPFTLYSNRAYVEKEG
jgi:hypothetical protein